MVSEDDKFLEVLTNVVIRHKGHGSYKNFEGALKALKKRTGIYSLEVCREELLTGIRVYDLAAALVNSGKYTKKANPASVYAEFEDIDFYACMSELKKAEPDACDKFSKAVLSWAILWFYLK